MMAMMHLDLRTLCQGAQSLVVGKRIFVCCTSSLTHWMPLQRHHPIFFLLVVVLVLCGRRVGAIGISCPNIACVVATVERGDAASIITELNGVRRAQRLLRS